MSRLLVIGCGGVAQVAIQKCAQNSKVFTEMCLASRTVSKCDALKEKLEKQASPDVGRQGLGSAVFASCAVGPEVVFKLQSGINERVAEALRQAFSFRIPRLGILDVSFQLAVAYVEHQAHAGIHLVAPYERTHGLHISCQAAVIVA